MLSHDGRQRPLSLSLSLVAFNVAPRSFKQRYYSHHNTAPFSLPLQTFSFLPSRHQMALTLRDRGPGRSDGRPFVPGGAHNGGSVTAPPAVSQRGIAAAARPDAGAGPTLVYHRSTTRTYNINDRLGEQSCTTTDAVTGLQSVAMTRTLGEAWVTYTKSRQLRGGDGRHGPESFDRQANGVEEGDDDAFDARWTQAAQRNPSFDMSRRLASHNALSAFGSGGVAALR